MSASRESTIAGVGTAHLSVNSASLDEDGGYVIHGIALGVGDITVGQSGIKKLWPASELEKAAESLEGTDLVRDHINTTEGKIGTVTHAEYLEDVGVIYEAEIASHYEEIAQDVKAGLMEVSVRAYHKPVEDLTEDEDTGALIVEDVLFDNLSVVNNGASPSNTANAGPVEDIEDQYGTVEASAVFGDGQSAAVLSRSTAVLEADSNISENYGGGRIHDESIGVYNDAEFAYVEFSHQATDGSMLVIDSAWARFPFYIEMHQAGNEYFSQAASFNGGIGGYHGPYDGHEEHENIELELDEDVDETQELYATLHYVDDDGEPAEHITASNGYVVESAIVVVEDDDRDEMQEARDALSTGDVDTFNSAIESCSITVDDTPNQGKPKAKGDQLTPSGIFVADGTWFAVAPGEHSDDSTSHAENAKYPLTSCTGENSIEAAWNLRGQGNYDIDQSTLEARIKRAAESMNCELSFMESASSSDVGSVDSSQSTESMKEKDYAEKNDFDPDHPDVFEDKEDAEDRAQELGIDGTHSHEYDGEEYYMPGSSHDMYLEAVAEKSYDDDEYSSVPTWEDGDKVRWQARPDVFGKVVHNPSDQDIVMVEIYEETDSGYEPTGYTVTAGYGDLVPMKPAEKSYNDEDEKSYKDKSEKSYDDEDEYSETTPDESDSDELESYEIYEPQFEDTTTDDWSELTLSDWGFEDWDDLNEVEREVVAEHFLLSSSGSTPDEWDDLALPVVDADGALNSNAVESAMDDVESLDDIEDDVVDDVRQWAESTLESEFDIDVGEKSYNDEDEMSSQRTATVATTGTISGSFAGNAELHSIANMIDYQTADPEELGDELDDPVVVEKEELEQMADKAEKAESVNDELGELSTKLDEQNEAAEIVANLSEEDLELIESETEFSVVEASEAEMYGEVQELYAEELAEHYPGMTAESLAEKFSPSELRDMVENHGEAELGSSIKDTEPEPNGGSASGEELSAEESEQEAEELRERYATKLENKGWTTQAKKVRDGEIPITAE